MSDRIDHRTWRKSSRSDEAHTACVEVGSGNGIIGVRDTKDRSAGTLLFDAAVWAKFAKMVKAGYLDL
jgi:hypothetical protein